MGVTSHDDRSGPGVSRYAGHLSLLAVLGFAACTESNALQVPASMGAPDSGGQDADDGNGSSDASLPRDSVEDFSPLAPDSNSSDGAVSCPAIDGTCDAIPRRLGGGPRDPVLAWTGAGFGAAWSAGGSIWFARLDPDGTKLGQELAVASAAAPDSREDPTALVWTGAGFGLARGAGYFQRLDEQGQTMGEPVRISAGYQVSLVWTGAGYGAAWKEVVGEELSVWFVRLDPAGQPIGAPVKMLGKLSGFDTRGPPRVAWSGSHFGLAWTGLRGGWFAVLDATGAKIGDEILLDSPDVVSSSESAAVAWLAGSWALVWDELALYFARFTETGGVLVPPRMLDPGWSRFASVAPLGCELGVAWSSGRDAQATTLQFARVMSDGSLLGQARTLDGPLIVRHAMLVPAGARYRLGWQRAGELTSTALCGP